MAEFYFNGKTSDDYGLKVKNSFTIPSSERDFEIQEIPGVDGDIFISNNRLKSVDMVFQCKLFRKVSEQQLSLFEMRDRITSWLNEDELIHDLYFSGDPAYIYRALNVGGDELERLTAWAGNIDLVFRCYPWKYLVSGKEEIAISSNSITLTNPLPFEALPTIKVQGTGSVTITFTNGTNVQTLSLINLVSTEEITIDCATEEVFRGSDNRSGRVSSYPFPKLLKGTTTIAISGTHSSFKLTPNWRMKI